MPRPPSRSPKAASPLRRFASARDGGVAVTVAIVTPILIGMAALSIDLGRAWSLQTELESAADAAALAGATQLDNEPGACDRAESAAVSDLIVNLQTFATDDDARVIIDQKSDIFFYVSLDDRTDLSGDPNDAKCDTNANYIEVRVEPHTVSFFLAPVLAVLTGSQEGTALTEANPSARAVAHMGQAICRVTPLFVCQPEGGLDEDPEGQGVWLMGGGASAGPGTFGFIAMGGQQFGADETREVMGSSTLDQCIGGDEKMLAEPGVRIGAASQGLNTRFDVYDGAAKKFESDPEFRPSSNPVKGLINEANKANAWKEPDNPYLGPGEHEISFDEGTITTTPEIDAMGYPRDNCAYLDAADLGSCTASGTDGQFGDGVWDFATYMAVNHDYVQGQPWPEGLPGSDMAPPTRFEVFQWELGTKDGDNHLPQQEDPPFPRFGTPQFPEPITKSRRVLNVAVVECGAGVKAGDPINPKADDWYFLFLTETMASSQSPDEPTLYGELMWKSGAPPDGVEDPRVQRNVLQLVE